MLFCAAALAQRDSFDALAAKAQAAREAGRSGEAIADYKAAVDLRPDWDEGLWYLGTLLYDTDHFEDAIPALRRLVDLHPNAGSAHAFLGLCEFETGDYPGSYIHLKAARELGLGDSPEIERVASYHLSLLLNLHGEFEQAGELLGKEFGPNRFAEQIKVAMGLALLRAPILPAQLDPSKDALVHAAGEAAVQLAMQDLSGAARSLEQLLHDYPGTPYVHYQYGLTLASLHELKRSESELDEETRVSATSPLPWIALSSVAAELKDFERSTALARKAVQLAPRSMAAQQALARALKGQNNLQGASAALKTAEELKKQAAEVEVSQASRYALAQSPAVSNGATSLASSNTSTASNFDEVARQADTERRAGRLESAATAYQSAVALRASWQEGWRQLGTIEYMRGRHPEAVSALQRAVALDARQSDTWTLLGLAEFETKDYRNSLVHLERGRSLGFTGNAAAVRLSRYHLALLLNLNSDFDRALDLLIPEVAPGPLMEEIQVAMGISLLRISALPEQIEATRQPLVRQAGEAAMLLSESRYDRAFPILERLLKEYPTTPFLHYAYGDALASTSMYDEAKTHLRQEIQLNPGSALPYLRLASVELQLHESADAIADARKAVALTPGSSEAHYLVGRALLDQGEAPAAISELEEARRLAPNSAKVHFNLARAYAKVDRREEAEQARAEFERLNALKPGQKKYYGERSSNEGTAPPAK